MTNVTKLLYTWFLVFQGYKQGTSIVKTAQDLPFFPIHLILMFRLINQELVILHMTITFNVNQFDIYP